MTPLQHLIKDLERFTDQTVNEDCKLSFASVIFKIHEYIQDEKDMIQAAHMDGQLAISCEVGMGEPSSLDALVYYEKLSENPISDFE